MKKVLFPILALVLALGLAVPVAAHTEDDPFVTDLMAGQHTDVGEVKVWNDDTNLYVQYVLDDPWVMTGSHLYVGKSDPALFPSTPGQFPYSPDMNKSPSPGASYDEATMTYTIPLDEIYEYTFVGKSQGKGLNTTGEPGVEPCNDVYIAAHADVVQKIEECMDVVSDASVEWSADGASWNPAVACWVHSSWNDIAGATWIWRTEYTDIVWEYDNVPEGGWYFKKEFTIPGEPVSGEIVINTDNAYRLSLNGVYVGGEGSMDKDGPDYHEWATIDTFDLTNLNSGANTIEVRALNFFRTGSSTSNPAGLAFSAEVCYEDIIAEETAWGQGDPFGTNWAMYFKYHIQEPCVPEKECVYFCALEPGTSVEGLGTVHEDLNIQAPGDVVKVAEGVAPAVYGAPNGPGSIWNGGMDPNCGGFSDITAQSNQVAHDYTFTFANGVSVSEFSLHMLDFGDWNPSKSRSHVATMTAYDADDNVVDEMTLEYNSDGQGNPRWSDNYGDLWFSGDAVSASEGQPGNWTWTVSGTGIVRVELDFGAGYDPNIAFDSLCFTIECP